MVASVREPLSYSQDDEISSALAAADPALARVIRRIGSAAVTPPSGLFPALARIILAQQLSDASATAIAARVETTIGLTPGAIADASPEALRAAGVSGRKSGSLLGLARAVRSGELDLEGLDDLDDDEVVRYLTRVRGIGRWTAQTFLLFVLQRPDVVVLDDAGIRAAAGMMLGLGRPAGIDELAAAAERWRPHRSAATLYLYRDGRPAQAGNADPGRETKVRT